MKKIFSQYKNFVNNAIRKILKKPLFIEIITGCIFSVVIIGLTVSGNEREAFMNDFERTEESKVITQDADYNFSVGEWDGADDWDSLSRGDALSETQTARQTITTKAPTVTARPVTTPIPGYTSAPYIQETEVPYDEMDEIEELPLVTLEPDATAEPEPEVILDPNGPVIVSDFESYHETNAFTESITITAYNPSGDKLPMDKIQVILNNKTLQPILSYNQSYSYILNYEEGINTVNVLVFDENNTTKFYKYSVYYQKPEEPIAIISVDADSIGLGYMIKPTAITIEDGMNVAYYVKQILSLNGFSTYSSGSQNKNYTFKGLYRSGLYDKCSPAISPELRKALLNNNPLNRITIDNHYTDFIKNGYFTESSKWIFELNGELIFDSMSNYTLSEGDILKVRYTLSDGFDLKWLDENYNKPQTTTPIE